eukprot:233940-Hanusia_phi.AAC.1
MRLLLAGGGQHAEQQPGPRHAVATASRCGGAGPPPQRLQNYAIIICGLVLNHLWIGIRLELRKARGEPDRTAG